MNDEAKQLRRFAEQGDEDAFNEIVANHFALVYSTALRQLNGDAQLAQDVAQIVFMDLARKARWLPSDVVLAGWLYKAARLSAAKVVRTEQRRRSREQEASQMKYHETETPPDWERLRPVLDAAIGKLNAKERDAVLLHYFEQKSFRAVGSFLGLSDDAAQKRVSRALDKLRAILIRGGVGVSISSLSTFLSAGTVPLAPAGLALTVAKSSLRQAAAMGPSNWTEILIQNLASAKAKLTAAGLLIFLCGGVTYLVYGVHPVQAGAFTPVDLTAYYNGGLDKSWTPEYGNNYLAALGEGRHDFKRVPFEIRGVVQLEGGEWKRRGYSYPETVEGIHVGMSGRRIHLLHANSAFDDPKGTTVASLVLHYSDGDQTRFDIRQGVEVLDWWEWPRAPVKRPTDANTIVAWTGSNPAAEHQGARIRLFETAFLNPQPEKEIQSIDYDSAMANSAPFMVALTIER
ncbi:MAG TPA: sigma-70 family RNA polymerase sigma factor [Verrucomicrobiae bacterium]|jgi:RNA polymerase sigma factor (sigma-70 family)